ncbi:hypothetical protein [Caudoviricetes sp.]|nr:hypothetical protein [Caudoviricetes sp.]
MNYQLKRACFAAGEAVIAPKALEYTLTFKFAGADKGVFPASPSGTTFTVKGNSISFVGGEETRDFSPGMELQALNRIVKQASGVRGEMVLTHPNAFLKYYQAEGPLVQVTITSENQTDASNDQSLVVKGILKLPDLTFLDNPGTISFEIESYGQTPVLTIPALPA